MDRIEVRNVRMLPRPRTSPWKMPRLCLERMKLLIRWSYQFSIARMTKFDIFYHALFSFRLWTNCPVEWMHSHVHLETVQKKGRGKRKSVLWFLPCWVLHGQPGTEFHQRLNKNQRRLGQPRVHWCNPARKNSKKRSPSRRLADTNKLRRKPEVFWKFRCIR